jgi:hypothetical protein
MDQITKRGETYTEMVKRLFKDMETPTLTLVHAAIGITGEGAELLAAFSKADNDNAKEELGDARFYMERLFQHFGYNYCQLLDDSVEEYSNDVDGFIVYSGEVQDLIKKSWVYNKPLDGEAMLKFATNMTTYFNRICLHLESSVAEIEEINMYKLSTGPNARYPLGYSDEAAIARADKA